VASSEQVKLIRQSLDVLIEKDAIVELRVPRSDRGPLGGLFNNIDKMANVAAERSGEVPGIYFTLNLLKKSLAGRVTNRLAQLSRGEGVRDVDVLRRLWLPVDFDPIRPAGTASTNAQHEAALTLAQECRQWLRDLRWPNPLVADSGNGRGPAICNRPA